MTKADYLSIYNEWKKADLGDPALLKELNDIEGRDEEIFDRFYRELEFGTAGLRGIIGAGTNRMNIITVGRATAGLAEHVKALAGGNASVAIAYDNRINSDVFARRAACVLAAAGVKVYIFAELTPTPMLSFALRDLKCTSGIVVTASHNPAEYNGFKVYGSDGGQLDTDSSERLYEIIEKIDEFKVPAADFDTALSTGIIEYVDNSVSQRYFDRCLSLITKPDAIANAGLKVVYTPLYGTGMKPVEYIAGKIGLKDFTVVSEQREPDGNFPTAPYPNPEMPAAIELALKLAGETAADIVVATDPDADRLSVAAARDGEFIQLSGNQMGCLLFDYIAQSLESSGRMPQNPVAIRSVVSTPMFDAIAERYGATPIAVLTGFKNIAQQLLELDKIGETDRYIFGFEESNGFLPGSFVRDKDGVSAAVMFMEMASADKLAGRTLIDRLDSLYEKYGYYATMTRTFTFPGAEGMEKMSGIMERLRGNPPKEVEGREIERVDDYKSGFASPGLIGGGLLPATNMLIFKLRSGETAIMRPSGTEPKLKLYVVCVGKSAGESEKAAELLANDFAKLTQF